jgi:hypothetical protein
MRLSNMSNRFLSCERTAAIVGSALGFRALAAFDLGFELVDEEEGEALLLLGGSFIKGGDLFVQAGDEVYPGDIECLAPVADLDQVQGTVAHLTTADKVVVLSEPPPQFALAQPFGFTCVAKFFEKELIGRCMNGFWNFFSPVHASYKLAALSLNQ